MKILLSLLLLLLPAAAMAQGSGAAVRQLDSFSTNQTLIDPIIDGLYSATNAVLRTNGAFYGTLDGTTASLVVSNLTITGTTNLDVAGTISALNFIATNGGTGTVGLTVATNVLVVTNGNVGIGTTTPTSGRLVVDGGGITFGTDNTYGIGVAGANRPKFMHIGSGGAGTVGLTVGSSVLVVTNGNVGIGTTTPQAALDLGASGNIKIGDSTWLGSSSANAYSFNSSGLATMNSSLGLYFNIDSDNTGTASLYTFGKDRTGATGGTTLATMDEDGTFFGTKITSTNGFTSYRSNLLAAATITVTASPFSWTNTSGVNAVVYIDGISVTGTVGINGGTVFNSIGQNTVMLQQGGWTTITYTIGSPTATWKPF